jgi:hypothetical protein
VDDELRIWASVIHCVELVIGHNWFAHGRTLCVMDEMRCLCWIENVKEWVVVSALHLDERLH